MVPRISQAGLGASCEQTVYRPYREVRKISVQRYKPLHPRRQENAHRAPGWHNELERHGLVTRGGWRVRECSCISPGWTGPVTLRPGVQ